MTGSAAWLIVALPPAGAAVLLLGGRRTDRWGHLLGVATTVAAFALGVLSTVELAGLVPAQRVLHVPLFTWLSVGGLRVDVRLLLDPLSLTFVLLITGVGALIHIYSVAYLAGDPHRRRFFGYLNLFVAAMLLLVLADDYAVLFIGWEGVGLASYLLIGFWQHKPAAAVAAKKAFVVNRVGDAGLLVAMMLMIGAFGSPGFGTVSARAGSAGGTATAIGLLLLLAACGKSAQVPLQSWLLDAMEGPTPVSALIHAATMVTAGVYLVARSHEIYAVAPDARLAVALVGAASLLFGAVIGCAKHDIKKALAASTMSQIGYMMLAAGLGPAGYALAITHLLNHGFFKAGLFLGAGSVMHAMDDEVDMRRYGGLRVVLPATFVTFGAGYLAIIGVPPFAGFFSKDRIIEVAFGAGGPVGWGLGTAALAGAGLTAFYMTRVVLMTFFGERRWAAGVHPHEPPPTMLVPMGVLALGSAGAGVLLWLGGRLVGWLTPVLGEPVEPHTPLPGWVWTVLILTVVGAGIATAWRQHARSGRAAGALARAARRDLYGDAVNEALFMRPGRALARWLAGPAETDLDGLVTGVGGTVARGAAVLRRAQTGYVRGYALWMFAGATLLLAAFVAGR
ncbi:NADH-quinone oxidoreductase subunit L [Amycolatopsis sp. K13G38]|uniref:NADH-quinone oxidoreductase subunit L n=1 Tax=Amycolatopsis acididurans TaxID=2724524 RepID=A0ABX1J7E0_9PSEU|nr:NADH-quinone oxidoreductase subunit L [Amycolatopsis acididurans]NKQ54350.1 NADH-quinone oxidoreductase subunit L [Amycolatopsis acididurans]